MLDDMDLDGVDAQVMHPNRSLFGLYCDDHELSIAHARVYNDYVIERYTPYFVRITPPRRSRSPTSVTPWPRSSGWAPPGSGPCSCRRCRPFPTGRPSSNRYGRRPGHRAHVFFHTHGGVKVSDPGRRR